MDENRVTPKGHRRVNYKRTKQRHCPIFPWKSLGYGRFTLCIISLIAGERVKEGDAHSRQFKDTGLTDKWLYDRLVMLLPWLPGMYLRRRGEPLTPAVVYHRWHKMVYNTKHGPTNSHSVNKSWDHPTNHPKLIPVVTPAEREYKLGGVITPARVARALHSIGQTFAYGATCWLKKGSLTIPQRTRLCLSQKVFIVVVELELQVILKIVI